LFTPSQRVRQRNDRRHCPARSEQKSGARTHRDKSKQRTDNAAKGHGLLSQKIKIRTASFLSPFALRKCMRGAKGGRPAIRSHEGARRYPETPLGGKSSLIPRRARCAFPARPSRIRSPRLGAGCKTNARRELR